MYILYVELSIRVAYLPQRNLFIQEPYFISVIKFNSIQLSCRLAPDITLIRKDIPLN